MANKTELFHLKLESRNQLNLYTWARSLDHICTYIINRLCRNFGFWSDSNDLGSVQIGSRISTKYNLPPGYLKLCNTYFICVLNITTVSFCRLLWREDLFQKCNEKQKLFLPTFLHFTIFFCIKILRSKKCEI